MVKLITKGGEETKVSLTVGSFWTIVFLIAVVIGSFFTLNAKVSKIDEKLDIQQYKHDRAMDSLKNDKFFVKMNKFLEKNGIED